MESNNTIDKNKYSFQLQEVASWSDDNQNVSLPTVQRDFVWKPSQIENLWDSLLRGYPIGSVVLAPKTNEPGKYELLDGQQRATAIALGFGKKTFKDETKDYYKIFIDLERPNVDDSRRFVFRVITKSHPWGYQRKDNTKPLTSEEKRDAMLNYYLVDDHTFDLSHYYPYDAVFPLPLNFFLDAAHNNDDENKLIYNIKNNWLNELGNNMWYQVKTTWKRKVKKMLEKQATSKVKLSINQKLIEDVQLDKQIKQLYKQFQNMLSTQNLLAHYVDFERIKKQELEELNDLIKFDNSSINENDEEAKQNSEKDSIENLFVRMNSGGTIIKGEELNYSIFKSHLKDTKLIDKINKACKQYIRPSRFIALTYLLYRHEYRKDESININIKPKQFQKALNEENALDDVVKNERNSFEIYLNNLLSKNLSDSIQHTLLEYVFHVLEYSTDFDFALPHLVVNKLADKAPEIMFMLLYRIKIRNDFGFEVNRDLHKKVIGVITLLLWLGKGEKQRDHSKVLGNVWPAVRYLSTTDFWSSIIIQRAGLNNAMFPIPNANGIKKIRNVVDSNNRLNMNVWDKINRDTNYYKFVYNIFYEQDLVLYAQRKFLSLVFSKDAYYTEDSNIPFDMDHIFADKYRNRKGLPAIITDWYITNGNWRAWPYDLNRIDQAVPPGIKLNPYDFKINNHLTTDNAKKEEEHWARFIRKYNNPLLISTITELNVKLKEWSFCHNSEWFNQTNVDLKSNPWPVHKLIMDRNFKLINEWYENLHIDKLIRVDKSTSIEKIFNKGNWNILDSKKKKIYHDIYLEDCITWITNKFKLNNMSYEMYIILSKGTDEMLNINDIEFGLYSQDENAIYALKYSEKSIPVPFRDHRRLCGNFTLISHQVASYEKFKSDIFNWISHIRPKKSSEFLKEKFLSSMNKLPL